MQLTSPDWSVAIFAAREAPDTLRRCIRATVAACAGRGVAIDVLVNSNPALAVAVAQEVCDGDARIRVWSVALGDKAHAWNEYLHRIWPGERPALFIDGYADVSREALAGLYQRLDRSRGAGRPGAGRRALPRLDDPVLKTGGMHGNLHAIDARTMAEMRRAGFRLPLGLYRTDSLIGAVLGFGLDPANNDWARRALAVDAPRGVRARARPRVAPASAAEQVAGTPPTAPQQPRSRPRLIHDWLVEHPKQAQPVFFKRPLSLRAARKLKAQQDWTTLWTAPEPVSPALRH
ncbi:MAG TPA: hypothetical protein VNT33_04190 [Telluria sp.]|nr:hypothetical protein [Telluria sp.]